MKPTLDEYMAELQRELAQPTDPFWLVREHTRIQQLFASEDTKLARGAQERNERIFKNMDSVLPLVLPE